MPSASAFTVGNFWPDATIRAKEAEAATKAAVHAKTPGAAYFDVLGRRFLTFANNSADGKYATRIELDIQGLQRSVTDALDRKVMAYDYDMLGDRIHQASMEAGERWMLNDVQGKAIRAWDTRGHNYRSEYDALRRPTSLFVQGTDSVHSDPRTLAAEVRFQKTDYGEGQPNDQALNLRTRVFQARDTAGIVTSMGHNPVINQDEAYDFKGNLLRGSRQFLSDHKALANWSTAPALLPDSFTSTTQYDAFNRPVAATTPDGSVVHPTYDEANFLETVSVNLQGAATATAFVTNIDYDAKGQRALIEYGNDTRTDYAYDPATFRLVHLTTTRTGFPDDQKTVQDLDYVYDPAGNITHIQDNADIQNAVFFRNQRIEPSNDYTYDAIYRLILASGREQLGLGGDGKTLPPTASSYNDVPRVGVTPARGDGNAVGVYTEQYLYDQVGNFQQFIHKGPNPADPGWTRTYIYNEGSLLEPIPGKFSNRLTRTVVSGNQPLNENYTHDVHGNMTAMPQLQMMQWNFKDELLMTQRQAVNASDDDGKVHQGEQTYYVYDASGQRARKVTESSAGIKKKERFYLGGFEAYREYDNTGTITLERETLHVMDDKQRVALLETRTQGNDGLPAPQLIRYQFGNHLGSASLELDDTATVISYEEYCPYGNTSYQAGRSAVEVALKRYRYTSMERDEETGLAYHGARYCAVWLGSWVSPDPIWGNDGPNLYIYTPGSPTRFTDTAGTGFMDFVGGFFDTVTFGGTRYLRHKVEKWTGTDDLPDEDKAINESSGAYKVGSYTGFAAGLALGGFGLVRSYQAFGLLRTVEGFSVATGITILGNDIADRIDPSGGLKSLFNWAFLLSSEVLSWFREPAPPAEPTPPPKLPPPEPLPTRNGPPAPIYGKAQKTGSPTHDIDTSAGAQEMSNQPFVDEVHMAHSYGTVSRGATNSRRIPDAAWKSTDGKIGALEQVSPTDILVPKSSSPSTAPRAIINRNLKAHLSLGDDSEGLFIRGATPAQLAPLLRVLQRSLVPLETGGPALYGEDPVQPPSAPPPGVGIGISIPLSNARRRNN